MKQITQIFLEGDSPILNKFLGENFVSSATLNKKLLNNPFRLNGN